MTCRAYERTKAWKASIALVAHVYQLTRDFPPEEKSGLAGSMRKSITALPGKAAAAYEQSDYAPARAIIDAADALLRDVLVLAQISQSLKILHAKQVTLLSKKIDAVVKALESMLDDLFEDFEEEPPVELAA
ncbi:MAG: four helix bundle protein [Planctomycetota bacterium]